MSDYSPRFRFPSSTTQPLDIERLYPTLSNDTNTPLPNDQKTEPKSFDSDLYYHFIPDPLTSISAITPLHLQEGVYNQMLTTASTAHQDLARSQNHICELANTMESYAVLDVLYSPTAHYTSSSIHIPRNVTTGYYSIDPRSPRPTTHNGSCLPLSHPASSMGGVPVNDHGEGVQTSIPRVPTEHTHLVCRWEGCTYTQAFNRKEDLLRHIKALHVSPQSYACDECGRAFNRLDNLKEHVLRRHTAAPLR